MKLTLKHTLAAIILVLSFASPVAAGSFEDGVAAYNRGDYATALRLFRPLADEGYAEAQYNLGHIFNFGEGVPQNWPEAVKWFRRAADQGYASGQEALGSMYYSGRGVAQDYKEAVKWYRLAAAQGSAHALFVLGVMYDLGQGVSLNRVRAYMFFDLSASSSNTFNKTGATKNRNRVAAIMSSAEIARAQELTRKCQQSNYKSCGEPESRQTATVTPSPLETAYTDRSRETLSAARSIPMLEQGGIYMVPVLIKNTITLKFVVDSGASDVSIPADVVSTLIRTGTLEDSDFLGSKTYILADGSRVPSRTFRIRSLRVGDRVLDNVTGSVASAEGHLLLGQSFLRRFKSWSIDNTAHALVLE